MRQGLIHCGILIALIWGVTGLESSQSRPGRPAPPPSRFGYSLKIDPTSLPPGVTVKENKKGPSTLFVANASDVPLIVNERFQGDVLAGGTKLVSGKVLFYFPSGIPQEGKQHLKGWQSLSDDIKETLVYLPDEPATIRANRKPGVSKDLPRAEPFSIAVKLNGKAHALRGTIQFHLNPEYDAFHADKKEKN